MKKPLFILLSILICLNSCDQLNTAFKTKAEDPNLIKSYHKNGKLKSEMPIDQEKKQHGLAKQYYSSGNLKSEIYYNHGVKEKAVQYYENGNKQMEFLYKDGLKHGKRTKYWDNGKIQSAIEYRNGNLAPGLKEYNKSGKQITKYPSLKIRHIDKLETHGQYTLEVYFSKNPGRGTYYLGKLKDGLLPENATKIKTVNGKGQIVYKPHPGAFIMETLSIIGSYKTAYGNTYLVDEKVNIAIDF